MKALLSLLLVVGLGTCHRPPLPGHRPPPRQPTTCEQYPGPYQGDLPCGFVDGIPV